MINLSNSIVSDLYNDYVNFKVVIPTRDSEDWILFFNKLYNDLSIKPLYICDTRSKDSTIEKLLSVGAEIRTFTPEQNMVESGMLEFASKFVEEEWIFRVDDDEFPTPNLIEWIKHTVNNYSKFDAFAISRLEITHIHGKAKQFIIDSLYWDTRRPLHINPQIRLYKHKHVKYIQVIHHPGFEFAQLDYAPEDCFFYHFDTIVKSFWRRVNKIRNYESIENGKGWILALLNLPELCPEKLIKFIDFTDEPLYISNLIKITNQKNNLDSVDNKVFSISEVIQITKCISQECSLWITNRQNKTKTTVI